MEGLEAGIAMQSCCCRHPGPQYPPERGGFLEGDFAEIIAETRRVVGAGGGVVVRFSMGGATGGRGVFIQP